MDWLTNVINLASAAIGLTVAIMGAREGLRRARGRNDRGSSRDGHADGQD